MTTLTNESKRRQNETDEDLLTLSLLYIRTYGGTAFCKLISDIKIISAISQLQYGEEILRNPSLMLLAEGTVSLDTSAGDTDDTSPLLERIPADDSVNPETIALLKSSKAFIERVIENAGLSPIEQEVVCRRFGLKGYADSSTLEEIALCMAKAHRQSIDRILTKTLRKLRYALFQYNGANELL